MITYQKRIENMQVIDDVEKQLSLAIQYAKRLHTEAKKGITLAEKIERKRTAKVADTIVRKIKLNFFDIQDKLNKA